MTRVDKINEVRQLKYLKGFSIGEIVRRTKLARNTVRKILRNDQTEFTYQKPEETPHPQTGPYRETIKEWLKEDSTKRRKQRRTATRMYALLRDDKRYKYRGSYESIARCVHELKRELKIEKIDAYIPLWFGSGQAFQFDWGEVYAYIGKIRMKLHIGIVVLCHSRHFYARAYPCQKQELMLDVQQRAFEFFGGACCRGIYDNLKTAVKTILKGKHPKLQKKFIQFCSYYLYEPQFCNPASGNEKGRVENKVGYVNRNFFVPTPHFDSLDELNERLRTFCISRSREASHPELKDKTCWEVYEEEKSNLVQLPGYDFDCCRAAQAVVSTTSEVHYDNNWYSVPSEHNHEGVQVKGYSDTVVISHKGKEIARHGRSYGKGAHNYNPIHYLGVLERKPGAFTDGAPFKGWELPEVFNKYRLLLNKKYDDGDKYFVKTLLLLKDWPIKDVTEAVSKAISSKVLGDGYVLSLLKAGIDNICHDMPVAIREDLAKYRAEQRPLSAYNEILSDNKEEKTNERK